MRRRSGGGMGVVVGQRRAWWGGRFEVLALLLCLTPQVFAATPESISEAVQAQRADWPGDLRPIRAVEWRSDDVRLLFERAGFGALPEDIERWSKAKPGPAVRHFTRASRRPYKLAFEHSGVFEPGLDPFPPSRPATTRLAKSKGAALRVAVKPGGNRPIQPVVNRFFYWLRASRLETDRVAYWWAERMLTTPNPLVEKTALFWHGHFATNEDKVRDYRKMLQQVQLFQKQGLGEFRTLLVSVAQNPAMLAFLDAGVNVKGSPNENFAREIMELFTMGVGHYSEQDVREAARAFTGWNFAGLEFHIDETKHDDTEKEFLGKRGRFDGVDIIDAILAEPVTAEFLASKLYRYFVREELSDELAGRLGERFAAMDMNTGRFLEMLFLSRDFYAPETYGARIKPPVELVVSTYRKLGLHSVPGVPDFNVQTGALGQRLLHPPTVAGWSQGQSWITPSLLFERGNFVLDLVFPDIGFVPPDRYPSYGANIIAVQERLRAGESISRATRPAGMAAESTMAASNALADRDEAFNTRYGSYRGWQMALERVKPIERDVARLELAKAVQNAGLTTPLQVVEYFVGRFFLVPPPREDRERLADELERALGTADIAATGSFAEEALRALLHQLLSLPEYQLG